MPTVTSCSRYMPVHMPVVVLLILVFGIIAPSSVEASPNTPSAVTQNQSWQASPLRAMVRQSRDLVDHGEFGQAWVILQQIIGPLEEQVRLNRTNLSSTSNANGLGDQAFNQALGEVYLLSGEVQGIFGRYEEEREFYAKAQNLATKNQDDRLLAQTLYRLGNRERAIDNLSQAATYYTQVQQLLDTKQLWADQGNNQGNNTDWSSSDCTITR